MIKDEYSSRMTRRIDELDGIRGIAILQVLIWHMITCSPKQLEPYGFLWALHLPTTGFWSGVDLFFVLSGFLIGGVIIDNWRCPNFMYVFWIRRCCRIIPVFLIAVCSCFLFKNILSPDRFRWLFHDLLPWWVYLTCTQNIVMGMRSTYGAHFLGITWSLAVEEQFYLVAPLAIRWFGQRVWVASALPLFVFAFFLRLAFPGFHTHVNTVFRMDSIVAGVAVAIAYRNTSIWSLLIGARGMLLATFFCALLATAILIKSNRFGDFSFLWFAVLYSLFLVVTLLHEGSYLTKVLRSKFLRFWGTISYGLYVYHQAVLGLFHGWLCDGASPNLLSGHAVLVTALAAVLSTVLAWVSFWTVESYFLNFGRRVAYRSQ